VDNKLRNAHNLLWPCQRACVVRWDLRSRVVYWLWFQSLGRPSLLHPWSGGLPVKHQGKASTKQSSAACVLRDYGSDAWGEVGAKNQEGSWAVCLHRQNVH
jgi:hypothetical protein